MFQAPLLGHPWLLAALVLTGTLGFSAVGTLFSAMLMRAHSRDVLLPVLLYTITIPVIIAGVRGTAAHILAGLWSSEQPPLGDRFLAVHLSGGTTELILSARRPGGFAEELLGGTTDLHAGQFVDRVGVALGLPFPAGPHVEALARSGTPNVVKLPSHVEGRKVSFSGPETAGQRLVGQVAPADLAIAVIYCVAKTLEKWLRLAVEETGIKEILIVGGVASNGILRERLRSKLEHPAVGARLSFAEARYSSDNAVGTAVIARANHMAHMERQG
jgi:N6-L-threonylcarbamoyladenine synthase